MPWQIHDPTLQSTRRAVGREPWTQSSPRPGGETTPDDSGARGRHDVCIQSQLRHDMMPAPLHVDNDGRWRWRPRNHRLAVHWEQLDGHRRGRRHVALEWSSLFEFRSGRHDCHATAHQTAVPTHARCASASDRVGLVVCTVTSPLPRSPACGRTWFSYTRRRQPTAPRNTPTCYTP